jgi:hypothetical protein
LIAQLLTGPTPLLEMAAAASDSGIATKITARRELVSKAGPFCGFDSMHLTIAQDSTITAALAQVIER